jgi:hypothetical protein
VFVGGVVEMSSYIRRVVLATPHGRCGPLYVASYIQYKAFGEVLQGYLIN